LRRLEGQHVCRVLEFGEVPDPRRDLAGLLYIALERIDGPALDALLVRDGLPPVPRVIAVLLDICEALREAHAQGVIHRDLKPGNVLVRGDGRAIVVDFGMAKIVTGGGVETTALTQHNMVFGTPEYMAPEQARGDELDARCDVYAAGIILYELLTGAVPFTGTTPLNVLTAHLTVAPLSPRARAPERNITAALEAVVLRALAKDPVERYATADALARAIRAAADARDDVDSARPSSHVRVSVNTTDALATTIVPRTPADRPVAPRPSRPSAPPPRPSRPSAPPRGRLPADPGAPGASASRAWVLTTVLIAIASIAFGAWLSTRVGR
jgi:serine/threonine-protein kinase